MKAIRKHYEKIFAVVDQAIASGGSFLTGILLARWARLEAFGTFTMMFMVVLLLNNFNQALITQPFLTLFPKQKDQEDYEQGVLAFQVLILIPYLLIIVLVLVLFDTLLPELAGMAEYMSFLLLVIVYQLHEFCRKFFYAHQKISHALILDALVVVFQLIAISYAWQSNILDYKTILFLFALSYAFAVPLFISKLNVLRAIKNLGEVMRSHWHFSSWLAATSLLQWLSGNYVFVVAGTTLGVSSVGILKIGQSLIGSLTALYQVIDNYISPRAAFRIKTAGEGDMWGYLFSVLAKGGIIVIISASIIALFPEFFVELLYGKRYADQITVFRMLALLSVMTFVGYMCRIGIRTIEKNFQIFLAYGISVVFNLAAASHLIAYFDLAGAVYTLIFSQILMVACYMLFYLRRHYGERRGLKVALLFVKKPRC